MSERFYVNYPLEPGPVVIDGAEAHHLATVCRVRASDRIYLFNGDGRQYPAEVIAATRQAVQVQILAVEEHGRELAFRLEVAAPLPKGDRGPFLLEKLTELGVTTFVPLRTRRSVVHPGENRLDRLQRHVIEASKQCGRNVLLQIMPLVDWATYCGQADLPAFKVLANPGGLPVPIARTQDCVVAVGPEGGLTEEEIERAQATGWQLATLGPRILRIETAALLLAAWAVYPP